MKIWITHLGDKMILKENDKLLFYTNKDKFNFFNVSFISFLAITMFEIILPAKTKAQAPQSI
jgi:hypothetical protein